MRWLIVLLVSWAAVAYAERRVAVVVADATLRSAPADAAKVAAALTEVAGFAADDTFVVDSKQVGEAFAQAHRRGATTLVVYYAGHVDGDVAGDLRRQAAATGATARVVIVDGCCAQGARGPLGARFDVTRSDAPGETAIVSLAADELAYGSPEVGGSLFAHHVVSALRGAGDADRDGNITVGEVYRYAYERVVEAHAPAAPEGVALAEAGAAGATLELPYGFDRVLVYAHARGQVIAELDAQGAVAVEPGRYAIRAWRAGRVLGGTVAVARGEHRVVTWSELSASDPEAVREAGVAQAAPIAHEPRAHVLVAGGASASVDSAVGAMPAMRAEVALPRGLAFGLIASSKETGGVRETSTAALVGYRLALARGGWSTWAGAEAGGGLVMHTPLAGPVAYSGAALAGPVAGIGRKLRDDVSLALEAAYPIAFLRQGGTLAHVALPAAWLGARFEL